MVQFSVIGEKKKPYRIFVQSSHRSRLKGFIVKGQKVHHRLVVIDKDDPDAFPLGAISTFDIVAEMANPNSVWQK